MNKDTKFCLIWKEQNASFFEYECSTSNSELVFSFYSRFPQISCRKSMCFVWISATGTVKISVRWQHPSCRRAVFSAAQWFFFFSHQQNILGQAWTNKKESCHTLNSRRFSLNVLIMLLELGRLPNTKTASCFALIIECEIMAAVGVYTSSCYFIINLLIFFFISLALYSSIKEK